MTASIGPWTFDAMRGRMNIAAPTTAPLRRGMRIGRPVAQMAELTTIETATTFGAAWSKAFGYRAAIGSFGRIVDDTGTVCEGALIADASVSIEKKTSGAVLTTRWSVMPAIWWGAGGQASVPVTGYTSGILPIAAPVIDSTEPASGYTVRVGNLAITYESILCTIQPLIHDGQREAVRRASADMGNEYTPQDQVGTVRCDIGVVGEEAARDIMRTARFQIGGFGSISIGNAVLLVPVAVADAQVTWHSAVGLGGSKDTLVTVTYSARLDENTSEDDNVAAATTLAVVQVASVWGQWQTVKNAICNEASEGLSATCGSTGFTIDAKIVRNMRTITNDLTDHTGKWVRILLRVNDTEDGNSVFGGLVPPATSTSAQKKMSPVWYGFCTGMSIHGGSSTPGAQGVYTCQQIQGVLDTVFFTRWYEHGRNLAPAADPGRVLPFNWDQAADRYATSFGAFVGEPDRRASVASDGLSVYYPHNRIVNNNADPNNSIWDLRKMIDVLMAAARTQYPDGPKWELAGQLSALTVETPSFDPHGKSVLDILGELLSPRHSLMFRVAVTAEPEEKVQLQVRTVVAANTAILGLGTIPANDQLAPLNLATDGGTATVIKLFGTPGIGNALHGERFPAWTLNRDRSRQVDAIYVEGGRPWIMATVRITATGGAGAHMEYDWTAAQETSWLSATTERRNDSDLAHVYRRFRLRADWNGYTEGHNSNVIMAMGRSLDGSGGEDGSFADDPNAGLPNARTIKLTRTVPIPEGVDLSNAGTFATGNALNIMRGVAPGRPMIFGYIAATGLYENLGDTLAVTVDSEAGTVELGHGSDDALWIYNYLNTTGNRILVTLGFLHALPWRMSWRRAKADRPRNMERAIYLYHSEMQYRHVLSGSIVGVNGGVARTVVQDGYAEREIDDANPGNGYRLALPLRLARFWFEDLHRSLSWTQTGAIVFGDSQPPGQLITDVTLPLDDTRRYVEAVNCPCTGRSWDFRKASLSTSWECDRLTIGFDKAIIRPADAGKQINDIPKGYS